MTEEEELLAWATLARTPGLDAAGLTPALAHFGSARDLVRASAAGLAGAAIDRQAREFLAGPNAGARPVERRWLESPGHHLLPFDDPRFPPLLRSTAACPVALYVCGNLAALEEPQLAIVGSRNPTAQGRETAAHFAQSLGARGLGIASGAAEGVDAAAHLGALRVQGITVGVLGAGIDVVYPRCHRSLYEDIARHGALVTEFPPGCPPRAGNFPRRNRIIAALSLATLVVEAARRSGSLITARWANAYGRDVFAVPGSIHNPLSRGCHALIKGGAKLAESADDILRELNFSAFFANGLRLPAAGPRTAHRTAGMDKDHKILLDALGFDPVDLDKLTVRTGFKPEAVSSMMLILELEGHVQAAPGGRYSRVAHRRAGGER